MNFAITGLGRSGTKSLAHALAINSNGVEVHHELDTAVVKDPRTIKGRFKDNYGEVSSYLRLCLLGLPVLKKAVIIRHPSDILVSVLSREGNERFNVEGWISEILKGLAALDSIINQGTHVIRFEQMVSCEMYRQREIYDWLGLACTSGLFPRIGEAKEKPHTIDIPLPWQFQWFVSKYYGDSR